MAKTVDRTCKVTMNLLKDLESKVEWTATRDKRAIMCLASSSSSTARQSAGKTGVVTNFGSVRRLLKNCEHSKRRELQRKPWSTTTCAGNWLRTVTSDQYTINRRFLFEFVGTISLDRNYREVINLLFVLPGLYLNILKTEKILQFWDKRFSTCVARHSSAKGLSKSTSCAVCKLQKKRVYANETGLFILACLYNDEESYLPMKRGFSHQFRRTWWPLLLLSWFTKGATTSESSIHERRRYNDLERYW